VFRFSSLASDYEVLSQSKQSVQNTYDTIIRRIQEIDINRMGGQGENMFVVAKATVPDGKAWPNKKKNLLLAGMFGLILAIGLCFFLDYLDMTIKSEMEVKHLLRCNVLTGIPDTGLEARESENTDMFSVQSPRSHFAEAFRTLRTALAFGHATPLRHIVVSSTFSKEGKTISAINLGIAQAQVGRRTLLVDADMRKPRLQRVFKANTQQGLSNLLTDRASVDLDKVIQPTSVENLFVLPCGPIPPKSVELLDSENFARLSKELVGKFDFVIYDSPPSFSMVDSMVIGKHTDGVILVVRSFVTPKNAARDLASRLRLAQVRLLGIILNNVDQPKGGYYYGGYYYGGYYYGRYSYYYSHYYEEEQSGKRPVKGWRRWLGPLAGHKKKLPPPVKPAAT
jgi:capsular exopolysaccharide synthesis family protein